MEHYCLKWFPCWKRWQKPRTKFVYKIEFAFADYYFVARLFFALFLSSAVFCCCCSCSTFCLLSKTISQTVAFIANNVRIHRQLEWEKKSENVIETAKTKNIIEIILLVSHQQFFPYLCRQIGNAHTPTKRDRENKPKQQQQKRTTNEATFVRILEIKSVNITKKKICRLKENWITPYLVKFHVYVMKKSTTTNRAHTGFTHSMQTYALHVCISNSSRSNCTNVLNGLAKRAHWNNCRLKISFEALLVNRKALINKHNSQVNNANTSGFSVSSRKLDESAPTDRMPKYEQNDKQTYTHNNATTQTAPSF